MATKPHLTLINLFVGLALLFGTQGGRPMFEEERMRSSPLKSERQADADSDGFRLQIPQMVQEWQSEGTVIAMIATGDYSHPRNRLTSLGYTVVLLPPYSGLDILQQYNIVYLPVRWAEGQGVGDLETLEAHASDYRTYVYEGGGLFVEQPNPFRQPGEQVTPTLLPHPITFYNWYEDTDCPPTIVDPDHAITRNLAPEEMPFPADQMIDIDPFYHILVVGNTTGSASLVIGEYGLGRILVETAHPNALTDCPFSDQVYIRMIEWLLEREVWQVYLPLTVRDW